MIRTTHEQLVLYSFPHLESAGAHNSVSTRHGGVSSGPFASLNVGYSVGDDSALVETNRRRLYEGAGTDVYSVVTCHQVHSTNVAYVGDGARGRGALSATNTIPTTDALMTDRSNLYLFLRFADCVPILFCDPQRKVVALAHAGWKGTVGDIVGATVKAMTRQFSCAPRDILAAIAPSIGPDHYEVKEDVAKQVRDALPFWGDVLHPHAKGSLMLDLPEANRRLLLAAGLTESSIVMSGMCTACHTDDFYSHRAENGKTGRFGVLIGWVGNGRQRD